jgi:hypothetical protein
MTTELPLDCAASTAPAVELALQIDKTPKVIMVGDYGSKALIDAEKAFWVMGGNKMGVMTHRAKWAFENREDAEKFIKENGACDGRSLIRPSEPPMKTCTRTPRRSGRDERPAARR